MSSTCRKRRGVLKREITRALLVAVTLLYGTALPVSGIEFAASDLEGIWNVHVLTSGDSPQWIGWMYGTQSIDAVGNVTFTSWTRSDGDMSLPAPAEMTVSSSGIVTADGIDFHGIMNSQKNRIVATMTDGRDGYNLIVSCKQDAATYSTSDLEGTWNYVGLISGDAHGQKPGWYWGAFTFDEDGDPTSATPVIDSLGNSDWIPSGPTFDISPAGIVTDAGGAIRGVMNSQKDMIMAVGTLCPGRDTAVCGYNLLILTKESAAAFSLADLKGTWQMHMLTSGDFPQHTGWAYGTWIVDDSGSCTVTSMTRSNGDSTLPPGPVAMGVPSSGIVTMPDNDFHGIMNSDRDTIVATMTDGGGGYDLIVYVNTDAEPGCPFKVLGDLNDDCKVDFVDFSLMADNWLVNCLDAPDDPACIPE
ncbi:MAG: hypothetical protein JSU70_12115 [Phycisphaerales bacterium]|nr:MAG: hypothetical protein JSU70_12115 [Phycisphaerales bacterium]